MELLTYSQHQRMGRSRTQLCKVASHHNMLKTPGSDGDWMAAVVEHVEEELMVRLKHAPTANHG
eukprot:206723-Chlamydomonas_euryale.AAC.1